jgi:hypothetical protein
MPTPVEKFSAFIAGQGALPLPVQPTDLVPVVRGDDTFSLLGVDLPAALSRVYASPFTGDLLLAAAGQGSFVLTPAAALATLEVRLPPTPVDGQVFTISTTMTISALTISGSGAAMIGTSGGPFVLAANGRAAWCFRSATNLWYPA